jgi:DNA-binding Lrp family transcriptional regulator
VRSTISLPLSAVDIGEFVSATASEVTRAVRELEQKGILKREGLKRIRVVDRSRFESLAG